jgi:hypothetical protein
MLAMNHCFIINGFVFLMTSGFLWHMSGTQLLTPGSCQTCEALGNEPLI